MSFYGLLTFCAVYALAVATPGPGVAARYVSLARPRKRDKRAGKSSPARYRSATEQIDRAFTNLDRFVADARPKPWQ